jgi:hypothetical protein
MTEPLGSSAGEESSGAKDNFIGKVIYSDPDQLHESVDGSDEYESDFEQVAVIEPLTEYEKSQYVYGMNVSQSYGSKWLVFAGHLENAVGSFEENGIESLDDLAEFLKGKVFEWRELTFDENEDFTWEHANGGEGYTANIQSLFSDMTNPPNSLLVPVRHVNDPEELAELGEEESAEVEEVDF